MSIIDFNEVKWPNYEAMRNLPHSWLNAEPVECLRGTRHRIARKQMRETIPIWLE